MYLRRTTILHIGTTIIYLHNIGARGFVYVFTAHHYYTYAYHYYIYT
jgi:hypothetical protein